MTARLRAPIPTYRSKLAPDSGSQQLGPVRGSLVFSGLPLEQLADNLARQLADKPMLARAIDTCDWPVMRDQLGASCAYFADARTRPSGFTLFERLTRAPYAGKIRVFQGNDDVNTLPTFTRQLEAWNSAHVVAAAASATLMLAVVGFECG